MNPSVTPNPRRPKLRKQLRRNLLRSRVTSGIGLVILVLTLASVYRVPGITWGDVTVPLVLAVLMLLMPDNVLTILRRFAESKAGGPVVVLLLAVALSGCVPALSAALFPDASPPVQSDSAAPAPPSYLNPPAGLRPAQARRWIKTAAEAEARVRTTQHPPVPRKAKYRTDNRGQQGDYKPDASISNGPPWYVWAGGVVLAVALLIRFLRFLSGF